MRDWDEDWETLAPRRTPQHESCTGHIAMIFAATLALMLAMLAAINWRQWRAGDGPQALPPAKTAPQDILHGRFEPCHGQRTTCIVTGDTIWFQGEHIRLADIHAPKIAKARCGAERDLGRKAASRLAQLLNAGAFSLSSRGGRVISRGGQSLGAVLVSEGLGAEKLRDWCQ